MVESTLNHDGSFVEVRMATRQRLSHGVLAHGKDEVTGE